MAMEEPGGRVLKELKCTLIYRSDGEVRVMRRRQQLGCRALNTPEILTEEEEEGARQQRDPMTLRGAEAANAKDESLHLHDSYIRVVGGIYELLLFFGLFFLGVSSLLQKIVYILEGK